MFISSNLTGLSLDWFGTDKQVRLLITIGESIFSQNKRQVGPTLHNLLGSNGAIDGTQLREHWFPQIEADIFISHSHRDRDLALAFAGWLWAHFRLKSFIDSCVWNYADDLLTSIDNTYCRNPEGRTYDYKKRNSSTSHVHMMLITALGMMIDSSEVLFFLNTPQSITTKGSVEKTQSPWLFAEIALAQIVRRQNPRNPMRLMESMIKGAAEGIPIEYTMSSLAALSSITPDKLDYWKKEVKKSPEHPLDVMYEILNL